MTLLAAASSSTLDIGAVLIDILVVLFAAKAAAELAERIRVPTVLGEIVAGILVGPSVLGIVGRSDSLTILAEIGVLLLLLLVGMEMDIGQLARVGRSAVSVALAGVALPFAGGTMAALALGQSSTVAIFLGAALTATSVGITARVFGDLRALGTGEARVVLGAAVVDDVLGLIILTVVVKLATGGELSAASIGGTFALAIGFLLVTGFAGRRLVPMLLGGVARRARGSGTLVAVALAVALGFAALADAAHLAPIIGAFMAGLALSGTPVAHRVERDLGPLGHVFMPVFFLQIGVEVDLQAMVSPKALGIAAVLCVVAVAGKLAAGRLSSSGTDRLLVGFGMIPRGEVGLIFAGIGVRAGVLDADLYGALITVVLFTTVITPPLLRWRCSSRTEATDGAPPDHLEVALAMAQRAGAGEPIDPEVLTAHRGAAVSWTPGAAAEFLQLLRSGGPRSWSLLDSAEILDRALPVATRAVERRRRDVTVLDPAAPYAWPTLDRLLEATRGGDPVAAGRFATLDRPDEVIVAAWVLDLADDHAGRVTAAAEVVSTVGLDTALADEVTFLVGHLPTFATAARRLISLDEGHLLELADHIGTVDHLRQLFLLARFDRVTMTRDDGAEELYQRILDALAHPELAGDAAAGLAAVRLAEATRLAVDAEVRERLAHAPRSLLVRESAVELARQARLIEPLPRPGVVRVAITPDERPDHWRIDVATRDRAGVLARIAAVFADGGLSIVTANVSTWPDGAVLDSFVVVTSDLDRRRPSARDLGKQIEAQLAMPLGVPRALEVLVGFDDQLMPWCTAIRVTGADQAGLLGTFAAALARLHIKVLSATVSTVDGAVDDLFAVTGRRGQKLTAAEKDQLVTVVTTGVGRPRRRLLGTR